RTPVWTAARRHRPFCGGGVSQPQGKAMIRVRNYPPKLGGVPSEARRGGSLRELSRFGTTPALLFRLRPRGLALRGATPPKLGGEVLLTICALLSLVVRFRLHAQASREGGGPPPIA